jgi:hypothetical protein
MAAYEPTPAGQNGARRHGSLLGISVIAGFVSGLVASACATSDAMLEKKRREEALSGEGGPCEPGKSEECYSGERGTAGRGACRFGKHSCDGGVWSACEGEVVPKDETCNKLDDDCDGVVDNGFERDGALCFYKGLKGACRTQGRWACAEDGTKSVCNAPVVKPVAETCNSIDDDCDGQTDEDSIPAASRECSTGRRGVCASGTNKCVKGQAKCVQDVQPGAEICNGLDDDCDGKVDNDCASPEAG